MKYLKKFETEADKNAWQRSKHVTPNVVLTADTGSVGYNVAAISGVFIQHIDGMLFTMEEWEEGGYGASVANGVAVLDSAARFVIAKEKISDTMAWASNTSTIVSGVLTTTDYDTAMKDYAGEANTALIAALGRSGAAYSCANYTFPNGQKGYLPALGEWVVAYKYKADIERAMPLIGGTAMTSNYHWSSTQYGADRAFLFTWKEGYSAYSVKSSYKCVRAFAALII